jgi:hypothetical protein
MGHSKSRCDTIIALIDECLADYDAALSTTKPADPDDSRRAARAS